MDRIELILTDLCGDIERRLKPRLHGVMGAHITGYLPQVWVFETEYETVSLVVDDGGSAHVEIGANPRKDVTIRWRHVLLTTVLNNRSRIGIPGGVRPTIMFHTHKGRNAYNLLGKRLGL